MKREAYRHPKMYDLASRLGVSRPTAIGHMTLLLDYTADVAPQGNVGKWPDGAIAGACDWSGDTDAFIRALVEAGWLDRCPTHRLIVHDLADHAERWWVLKLQKLGLSFIECSTDAAIERSILPSSSLPSPPNPSPAHQKPLKAAADFCGWSQESRKQVLDALEATGLQRFMHTATVAQTAGLSPAEVLEIVSEYNANVSKLRSPGAILDRIQSGAWPSPDVKPVEVISAHEKAKQNRERKKAAKKKIDEIVMAGRGASDEVLIERIHAAVPEEFWSLWP